MKIRLIKAIRLKKEPNVQILPGAEIETTGDIAREMVTGGYALEAAAETAMMEPAENAMMKKPIVKTAVRKK
jgi:hypothetical protein